MSVEITVECADLLHLPCDVAVLKVADELYGVSAYVAQRVGAEGVGQLKKGKHTFVPVPEMIAKGGGPREILFQGVGSLWDFSYTQIAQFATQALRLVHFRRSAAKHVAFTIHGPGYGLDEHEAVLALYAGISASGIFAPGWGIERISIVEKDAALAAYAERVLTDYLGDVSAKVQSSAPAAEENLTVKVPNAGSESEKKPRIFVAMPFAAEFLDEWQIAFSEPANNLGFLCERMDLEIFHGDIIQEIKKRIERSSLVLGLLTGDNANVYLEVGYAWGVRKPTVLAIRDGAKPKFDLQSQRYLTYSNITELRNKIAKELSGLREQGTI